ncbi:MAG TPA: CheR family methyltransferase, partial [Candidatus Goldiibacteriota bacterium]|nr:CheR family methyltransferase [Candidatus Goldiibacteriota bacterium]
MIEKEGFEKLKNLVFAVRGLDVGQYKENYLKRRFAVRMRALQISDYGAYASFLEKNPQEFDILMDKLTINVTQFFRDTEVFSEFENTVLLELFENKKNRLCIWSAGCSSGEEPYSIAISVMETAEKSGIGSLDLEIQATD